MSKLKICYVSSEIYPFAKTGGLADVSAALGKYLSEKKHDIRLIMPLYSVIDMRGYLLKPMRNSNKLELKLGGKSYYFDVYETTLPKSSAKIYFIHCPVLYHRTDIYSDDWDEPVRFAFLSKAAIEICKNQGWYPDIFHCNDWQTALIPVYLKTHYRSEKALSRVRCVLTLHNIGYQGVFNADKINDIGLSDYYQWFDSTELYFGKINFLRTGIMHSDKLTTVSRTYAEEIQTPAMGEGLDALLRSRSKDLSGIVNGVDYETWNPTGDPWIKRNYSAQDLRGKVVNKRALLKSVGLTYRAGVPVMGMVTRLVDQKGIELLNGSLQSLFEKHDVQFIILGNGQQKFETFLYQLQLSYPEQLVFYRGYHNELSHMIEAGADMFVMPSRYEPCGLNQIYSLKYGTIPIVRRTGGLADTVEPYNWQKQSGTGFVFEHYTPQGLLWAMEHALTTFSYRAVWRKLMKRAMQQDFSWSKQVDKYIKLYEGLLTSEGNYGSKQNKGAANRP